MLIVGIIKLCIGIGVVIALLAIVYLWAKDIAKAIDKFKDSWK